MRITSRKHTRRQQLHAGVPEDLYNVFQIVASVKMLLRWGLDCGRLLVPANGLCLWSLVCEVGFR